MTSLQSDSCLLALRLYWRNCSVSSVEPPTNTSGRLMPLARLLARCCALLTGEKLQGKLALKEQLKTKPRSSCAVEIKSPTDNQHKPEEASRNFVFIAWFVLSGAEFNSCN